MQHHISNISRSKQQDSTVQKTQKAKLNPIEKVSIAILLQNKGIQPTALRVKIASVILSKIQHLTLTQIRRELKHSNTMISDTAMIKTLRLFDAHNVVRKVYVDSNTVFYDSNTCLHSHFFNASTGELIDIPAADINICEATSTRFKCDRVKKEFVG